MQQLVYYSNEEGGVLAEDDEASEAGASVGAAGASGIEVFEGEGVCGGITGSYELCAREG